MSAVRDDIQDGTGQRSNIVGRGFTRGFGIGPQYTGGVGTIGSVAGNPIQGEIGWAPGAIFINPLTSVNGNFIWCNIGTFASANWVAMLLNDGAGNDTFATLTDTVLLRGGLTGLTVNAAVSGGTASIGLGKSGDSIFLGGETLGAGNPSAALGFGTPSGSSTTGFTQTATTPAVSSVSTFTGGVGASAYTLTDVVYMLKEKGILAF